MATPNDLQSEVSAAPWMNGKGLITGITLFGMMTSILGIFGTMGSWSSSGTYTPNIPPGTVTQAMLAQGAGGSINVVPERVVATSGAVPTTPTDFLVCLNGPSEVDLEATPAIGVTHVLKDCRPGTGNGAIAVVPQGSLTIDGATSYSMTQPAQSITVTYTTLGWSIY